MGLVTAIEANQAAWPHHILITLGVVGLIVGVLAELRFKLSDFVL
jgi:hypothetical protein